MRPIWAFNMEQKLVPFRLFCLFVCPDSFITTAPPPCSLPQSTRTSRSSPVSITETMNHKSQQYWQNPNKSFRGVTSVVGEGFGPGGGGWRLLEEDQHSSLPSWGKTLHTFMHLMLLKFGTFYSKLFFGINVNFKHYILSQTIVSKIHKTSVGLFITFDHTVFPGILMWSSFPSLPSRYHWATWSNRPHRKPA